MDVYAAIRDLYAEKRRIDRVIGRLEELQRAMPVPKPHHRGRKRMQAEEQAEVLRRLTEYWKKPTGARKW